MKNLYFACLLALSIIITGCASSSKYAVDEQAIQKGPSATITLNLKEMALGIGVAKGEGILTYQGVDYPIVLKGMDYGSISKINLQTTGEVYHLDNIDEFEGIYFRAKAGLTIGRLGKTGMFLVNRKGTTIHLSSQEEKGFDLSLARSGLKIQFVKDKPLAKLSNEQ